MLSHLKHSLLEPSLAAKLFDVIVISSIDETVRDVDPISPLPSGEEKEVRLRKPLNLA